MDKELQNLLHRLSLVGYKTNEINMIVRSIKGREDEVIKHLEKYEQLGLYYINNYSQ